MYRYHHTQTQISINNAKKGSSLKTIKTRQHQLKLTNKKKKSIPSSKQNKEKKSH
jgi:hypothetical protein